LAWTPSKSRKRPIANIGRLLRQELERINLPPEERNFPNQVSILEPSICFEPFGLYLTAEV
jgi:hypothetical protein